MKTAPRQQPLLGILGGMGPLATVDFLAKLTRSLPASCDQEHLAWLTLSQPGTPDRSRAIQNGDNGPHPYLTQGAAWLSGQGVSLIAIPCSTSHYWYEAMQRASSAPILHIADATIEELLLGGDASGPVAVLATRGTVRHRIYSGRLHAAGCEVAALDENAQRAVDGIIRDVKAGQLESARREMHVLKARLKLRGVRAVVLGCTELPIAHDDTDPSLPAIDVTLALARAALRRLGYPTVALPLANSLASAALPGD
ncbi:MAG TPA: amino acid racemase [Noviherbaspirillum sp.]|nr:amino acid racemase [Noviherbaspirillum sp.]